MTDESPIDPKDEAALATLEARIRAAQARRDKKPDTTAEQGANQGYQALGELLGGVLGGLGLGYLADTTLGTKPWAMIIGTLVGMVAAVWLIARPKPGKNKDQDLS